MSRIFFNGTIFTADRDEPFVEALVSDGETIVYVGTAADAFAAAGADAEAVDLEGRMLMPGIHDAHTHLLASGVKYLYETRLPPFASADRVVATLAASPASTPGVECCAWHVGGEVFPPAAGDLPLTRSQLDEAYPDQPVYLFDYSIHHGVANSTALELAAIDEDAEFGHGGVYRRDGSGRLTGELIEEATWKVLHAIPDRTAEEYRSALRWAISVCHQFGITSVQEASASRQALDAYRDLDDAGELDLHVAAHLVWRNEGFGMGTAAELDAHLANAEQWRTRHLDPGFVKIWIDGAPLPPVPTHATLDENGRVDGSWLLVAEDALADILTTFDAAGRTVKVHCAGEGAVRTCLNALKTVRSRNGAGVPHEVAHAGFVADDDFARFTEVDATAEMSPALWHIPEYGLGAGFHFARMVRGGVRMTIGSDWIITPNPNLFPGIQGAVQHATQPIDLRTALEAVTRVGAEAVGRAHHRGTLGVGKSADFILLDRDLFAVDDDQIGDAVVLETYVEGRRVYARDAGAPGEGS